MNASVELAEHLEARNAWNAKPSLRTIYRHMFSTMLKETVEGAVLEIGGGSGLLKAEHPAIISSDIHRTEGLDVVASAEALPFGDSTLSNVIMLDVLHHIPTPRKALLEIQRVLKPGGRLVMLEPGISAGSYLFYKYLHPERVDMRVDPLSETPLSSQDAFDSNQAIPTLLVSKYREQFSKAVPALDLMKVSWMSLLAYPLSGGFRPWNALPLAVAAPMLRLEEGLPGAIKRLLGFRVLIVMQLK